MRKHVISKKFISSEAVSADFTSDVLNVAQMDSGSIHLSWASGSTPNIDVYMQVRNGEADAWRSLDLGSTPNISGSTGEHDFIFNLLPFTDLRVFLDRASGSATVSASMTFKTGGA